MFALVGLTVSAVEQANSIESSDSEDSITVQPNGYFEFSTKKYLNNAVDSYGDLVDTISQLTAKKLAAFRAEEQSSSLETTETALSSSEKQVSSRASRTWKRRILVLLDGKRVTGTADRSMIIEDHLGVSLDDVKSLEGFLSMDVEPSEHNYPRVLNFVSDSPDHHERDSEESEVLEPEKTRS